MIASKITADTLERAAQEIGVTLDMTSLSRTQHRVKVNPLVPETCYSASGRRYRDERGDAPYQRTSSSGFRSDRRVSAVCWHGFRDFFRACYRIEPNAVFRTGMATWKGSEHFEENFQESGHRNIGSQMYPMAAAEACRCPESGSVGGSYSVRLGAYNERRALYTNPVDTYGADEADGAACRAMANALRSAGR